MKIKKQSGFSLMEMMVVLLIVAIVLAATAPMVSKKVARQGGAGGGAVSDTIWATGDDDNIYNAQTENPFVDIGSKGAYPSNDKGMLSIRALEHDKYGSQPQILMMDFAKGKPNLCYMGFHKDSLSITNNPINKDTRNSVLIGYGAETDAKSAATVVGSYARGGTNSTVFGCQAAAGADSIAIGPGIVVNGENTIAIGNKQEDESGNPIEVGGSNVSVGIYTRITGSESVAVGTEAKTGGKKSVAIGYQAEAANNGNVAVGSGANASGTEGCVALGSGANASGTLGCIAMGSSVTAPGEANIVIGSDSHAVNDYGSKPKKNVVIGYQAKVLEPNSGDSESNVVVGAAATAKGSNNVVYGMHSSVVNQPSGGADKGSLALGYKVDVNGTGNIGAGSTVTVNGTNNIALNGSVHNTGGSNNVMIGSYGIAAKGSTANYSGNKIIGERTVYGSNNIILGDTTSGNEIVGSASTPINHAVAIGYGAAAESNTITLGNATNHTKVHIPAGKLIVDGDLIIRGDIFKQYWQGSTSYRKVMYQTAGGDRMWWTPVEEGTIFSDRRLKNVGEVFKGGLAELKKLDIYNYTFKKDENKTPRVGVMAQDLQKIFPNAVIKGEDGYLSIRMEDMFYAVVNAIKELDAKICALADKVKSNFDMITKLQEKIEAQAQEITELKKQNAEFEKRLAKLEKKMK